MMRRIRRSGLVVQLAAVSCILAAGTTKADVLTIHDQVFLLSAWDLINLGGTNVTGMAESRIAGGGVTGDMRRITVFGNGSITYTAENYKNDVCLDASECAAPSFAWEIWYRFSTASTFAVIQMVARQGESYYLAPSSYREPQNSSPFWQRHTGSFPVSGFLKTRGPGPNSLSFGPGAPPICFGYRNSSPVFVPAPATHDVSFFVMNITRTPLPLASQPEDASACEFGDVTMSLMPTGTGPFTYQWRMLTPDPIPLVDGPTVTGSIISGATSATLAISNVSAADASPYDCIVSSACGAITSDTVDVLVFEGGSGDGDGNGTTDGNDIAFLSTFLLTSGTPSSEFCALDMNCDGVVTVDDVPDFITRLLE